MKQELCSHGTTVFLKIVVYTVGRNEDFYVQFFGNLLENEVNLARRPVNEMFYENSGSMS